MIDYTRLYKEIFFVDGSLRDIYVLDTTLQDWQTLVDFLRQAEYPLEFVAGQEIILLPERIEDIFALTDVTCLTLYIDKEHLALNCHFFTEGQIEFDLDPRDFHTEQQVDRLLNFMRKIGKLLHKKVILTPENLPKSLLFRFDSATNIEEWFFDEGPEM